MSTIKSKHKTIAISLLHTQAFCEHKLYLEEVKGFKAPPTQAMLQGLNAHSQLKTQLLITRDSIISIEEALLQAESVGREIKKREFMVTGKILRGRIDEIYITPNEITIIDDKPGLKVHASCTNQVFGYCLAFKEQYSPKQPIFSAIRSHDTGHEIWKELFSAEQVQRINDLVDRIQGIIQGTISPIPNQVHEICSSCRFNYLCKFRS